MAVLLVGDENLTFSSCLLQQLRAETPNPKLTVAVTLTADNSREEVLQRAAALSAEGVSVLFGISPLQLKTETLQSRFQEFIAEEVLQRAAALSAEGVSVLFGISPLQLKTETLQSRFQEFIAVLPGLPFHGCPDFIPFASPLFQLRLHHFIFSYHKNPTK
ncbi:hypothetical protein, conserved [Eimeria acervulina]|uniref:Uncharacterized protein n=1 Tax=Eimeria acervulina TaxID=5801 RepID=U6GKZ9_EIMAC|nr:hypothetical protein, conserved [Eimeria acervulina]CDI80896.1 hypothetical protein, conserved [Eimeria acervulina]